MYEIMYSAGLFFTPDETRRLRIALSRLGATIMELREECREVGLSAWNVTPKMHMIQHRHTYPCGVNPRWVQCYTAESSIGTTTAVWSRSASGRYRRTIQQVVLLKRLVALMIRFETDNGV